MFEIGDKVKVIKNFEGYGANRTGRIIDKNSFYVQLEFDDTKHHFTWWIPLNSIYLEVISSNNTHKLYK